MKLSVDHVEQAIKYAQMAIEADRRVFVWQFPGEGSSAASGPLGIWAQSIEAIEAAGWEMCEFTTTSLRSNATIGKFAAIGVFRRRKTAT